MYPIGDFVVAQLRRRLHIADLERDDVVRRIARQRGIEIRETANMHAFNRVTRLAIAGLALRQATLQRALIAQHQDTLPLTSRATLPPNGSLI